MHVVVEGLFVFGEVSVVEFVRLQQHVENEHFDKDHQSQHELFQ